MTPPSWLPGVGRTVGLSLYVGVGLLYLVSGLVVPVFPWLILLNFLWAAGLVQAIRWSRERWWMAAVVAAGAVVFWVAYVAAGEALLGWTA